MIRLLYALAIMLMSIPWFVFIEWVRHRPSNLDRGTQHLVIIQLFGCIVIMVGSAFVLLLMPH
jgi:arginine exporter protein ArgO